MIQLAGLICAAVILAAAAADAQTMAPMSMPGMSVSLEPAPGGAGAKARRPAQHKKRREGRAAGPRRTPPPTDALGARPVKAAPLSASPASTAMGDMPGMAPAPNKGASAMSQSPSMTGMAGMEPGVPAMAGGASMSGGAMEVAPIGPAPAPPTDHAADGYFDPTAMAAARAQLRDDHGGMTLSQIMDNLAEYQARSSGGAGYRWDAEAWVGGDLNRLVMKSEGEGGTRDGGLDSAEVQGLYSRAISAYFNVQGGVRQDLAPHDRTYAAIEIEGLAPYWIDVTGALFVSTRGELLARAEASYDLRLTQRLILQPRVELNFAAQDTAETRTGSGLSNVEAGLRLRYDIGRRFAPYIGVSYDRKLGRSENYARLNAEDPLAASVVVGVRAWF